MNLGASGTPAPTGTPTVNQTFEPSWVRNGSDSTKKAYALAQNFEEMLVQELSQEMASTSGLAGEESSGSGESAQVGETPVAGTAPMTSELSGLIPQALSSGVMSAGGLGLATQLTRELEPANTPALLADNGGLSA